MSNIAVASSLHRPIIHSPAVTATRLRLQLALFGLTLLLPALALSAVDPDKFESKRAKAFAGDSRPICTDLPIDFDLTGRALAFHRKRPPPDPFGPPGATMGGVFTTHPNEIRADNVRLLAAWPQAEWVRAQIAESIRTALREAELVGTGDSSAEPARDAAGCPYRLYLQPSLYVRFDLSGVVINLQATMIDQRTDKLAYRGRLEADGPVRELLAIGESKQRQSAFTALPTQTLSELIQATAQRAGRALAFDLRVSNPKELGNRRVSYEFGSGVAESLRWVDQRGEDLLLRSKGVLYLVNRPSWVSDD
jgi:hypothetical protein